MQPKDLMIDLETLGLPPAAAILSIGAVWFEIETGELGEQFYTVIDIENAAQFGTVDAGTIKWWMNRDMAARKIMRKEQETITLPRALLDLNGFIGPSPDTEINLWGNGATFDCTILENAYQQTGIKNPIPFKNYRDVRTVVDLGRRLKNTDPKNDLKRSGTHHNALDDALFQAAYVMDIIEELRGVCGCNKERPPHKIGTPCEDCGGLVPGIIMLSENVKHENTTATNQS